MPGAEPGDGAPAQVKRPLTDQELAWKQRGTAEYQHLAQRCMNSMVECPPLAEAEPDARAWKTPVSGPRPGERMNLAATRHGQAAHRTGIVGALSAHSSPMSSLAPLNHLITRFQEQTPIRASSLIITLYGDAIEPHGGTVWLGSLINLLEPIGINERLIRTSIFRLTKEGWLTAEKVGRRSYYSLTGTGRRRFEKPSSASTAQPAGLGRRLDAGAAVAARCRQAQGRA
jgi:hypothetical protein